MNLKFMLALVIILGYMSLSLVLRSGENEKWNENQSTTVDKISHSKTVDLGQGYTKDWCEGGVTVNVSEARPHKVENVKYSYDGKFGWWGKASGNQDIIIYNLSYKYLEEEEHAPIIIGDVTITDTTKSNGKGKNSSDWSFDVTTKYNIIHCKNYSCTNNIVPWDPDTKNLIPYISSDSPYKTNKILLPLKLASTWDDITQIFYDSAMIVTTKARNEDGTYSTKVVHAIGTFEHTNSSLIYIKKEFENNLKCDSCGREGLSKAAYLFDYTFYKASITIPDFKVPPPLELGPMTTEEWLRRRNSNIEHERTHRKYLLTYILSVLKPTLFKYKWCSYSNRENNFLYEFEVAKKNHEELLKKAYNNLYDANERFHESEKEKKFFKPGTTSILD